MRVWPSATAFCSSSYVNVPTPTADPKRGVDQSTDAASPRRGSTPNSTNAGEPPIGSQCMLLMIISSCWR